ncbi:uncharacterized protein LOC129296409 [Prosopis cineraria]|uniref:uncharacterized protein LOC129296409 n=1 Tax=Prosopis cineraria TaxID=364024 RepID=UPI00241058BF|nr:uncharacterized protein LOC129296409 [Prosopis cineraria]
MESSRFRDDDSDFNISEWSSKARISRHNTMSRRFFREDSTSFRSNFTVSSTASSPGYPLRDEIDPSTYCFSTALKALQARSGLRSWEYCSSSSPEGFALNSKWSEAEKYISNPLSGKVPLECLSAKSRSGRSFIIRNSSSSSSSNRIITMSAPLVYPSTHLPLSSSSSSTLQFPVPEKKKQGGTRDVGTQSTPPCLSSSSPSPASTPSIIERAIKRVGESPVSNSKTKSEEDQVEEEREKERQETQTETTRRDEKEEQLCSRRRQAGCFSWILRDKKTNKPTNKYHNNIFPTHHFKPC